MIRGTNALAVAAVLAVAWPASLGAADKQSGPLGFFEGRTESISTVKVILKRAFKSRSMGRGKILPDGTLDLVQRVEDEGAPPRERRWKIRQTAPGRFTGTMSEAVGPVVIEETPKGFLFRFKMKDNLAVEQWLFPRRQWRIGAEPDHGPQIRGQSRQVRRDDPQDQLGVRWSIADARVKFPGKCGNCRAMIGHLLWSLALAAAPAPTAADLLRQLVGNWSIEEHVPGGQVNTGTESWAETVPNAKFTESFELELNEGSYAGTAVLSQGTGGKWSGQWCSEDEGCIGLRRRSRAVPWSSSGTAGRTAAISEKASRSTATAWSRNFNAASVKSAS